MKFKRVLAMGLVSALIASGLAACGKPASNPATSSQGEEAKGELSGDITFWHSFTQGDRLKVIQEAADAFQKEHPKVHIKIETFSWNDFYQKWTTGLTSGNVPDMSTALPNQVVEMINADAISPLNDLIDSIGRDKFSEKAINEGTVKGKNYSIPLYSHAQAMWIRKDLLEAHKLAVPKTWDEFYQTAKALTDRSKGIYGCSFPTGSNDFIATRFLNLYVRSRGGSLLTKDKKANLTDPIVQDGIKFWLKVYKDCSPKDSINYNVLDQATLYYQGKTAFDFNSGFQINGVAKNSPNLLKYIDCEPVPRMTADEPHTGIETANQPMVIWKKSKHPEICKAFMKTLYQKDTYIKFLHSVPVGMLPSIKGISDDPAYLNNDLIKEFKHAEGVIAKAIPDGAAIGYEYGPSVQAGLLTNQHIIEKMFQDIITNGTDTMAAAQKADNELNQLFKSAQ